MDISIKDIILICTGAILTLPIVYFKEKILDKFFGKWSQKRIAKKLEKDKKFQDAVKEYSLDINTVLFCSSISRNYFLNLTLFFLTMLLLITLCIFIKQIDKSKITDFISFLATIYCLISIFVCFNLFIKGVFFRNVSEEAYKEIKLRENKI